MKFNPMTFLVLLLSVSSTAIAGTYGWDTNGNCRYVSDQGRLEGTVDDSYCGGGVYNWDGNGSCRYMSLGGRWDGVVPGRYCPHPYEERRSLGDAIRSLFGDLKGPSTPSSILESQKIEKSSGAPFYQTDAQEKSSIGLSRTDSAS